MNIKSLTGKDIQINKAESKMRVKSKEYSGKHKDARHRRQRRADEQEGTDTRLQRQGG